jgi:predicted glycosyltransferase
MCGGIRFMSRRILCFVQHLLGIGHVRRSAAIVRQLLAGGHTVEVLYGGFPVGVADFGNAAFTQLPPVKAANTAYTHLIDSAGAPLSPALSAERLALMLARLAAFAPDVLMMEMFPFGRRQLRGELIPLLEQARAMSPKPVLVSSVRDVLIPRRDPAKDRWMAATANQLFDHIIVHADPQFIQLADTFAFADLLTVPLHYSGYVVERESAATDDVGTEEEVLVSTGGGQTGEPLLKAALAARRLGAAAGLPWRLRAGPNLPAATFERLRAEAATLPNTILECAQADFPARLRHCALSISQAGYNTAMDILAAGCRAIVVPLAGDDQTEQTYRAERLAARGAFRLLPTDAATPDALRALINTALTTPKPTQNGLALDLDGSTHTAQVLAQLAPRLPTSFGP